jgi:hypothetical protein
VSITSGVWPDPQTSIEPTIWGVGSDVFAFLVTHHHHGEQKHATAAWLKESLMITALAERAMSLWPNKGDEDNRPPLGSGYERVDPVIPQRLVVPAGAPGELRLDAQKSDLIPAYPY